MGRYTYRETLCITILNTVYSSFPSWDSTKMLTFTWRSRTLINAYVREGGPPSCTSEVVLPRPVGEKLSLSGITGNARGLFFMLGSYFEQQPIRWYGDPSIMSLNLTEVLYGYVYMACDPSSLGADSSKNENYQELTEDGQSGFLNMCGSAVLWGQSLCHSNIFKNINFQVLFSI